MDVNLVPLLPAIQVLVTALVVLVRDLFIDEHEPKGYLAFISLLGIGLAVGEALLLWGGQESAFGESIVLDSFALYFSLIFLLAAALTILSAIHYLRQTGIHEGEFYALILFATVGMIVMAAANDLLVFFLGLGNHVHRRLRADRHVARERSLQRSGDEVFYHGRFCHRVSPLRYRVDLWRHRLDEPQFDRRLSLEQPSDWPLYLIGGGFLLLVGFAFKVGAVPFHFWVPDVYEGAPTPVTGFMAVAVKAAAFAAWARILLHKFSPLDTDWVFPLWVIAIGTMTFGNLLAITQTSVKRMLAYSSIAHAGYLLIAIVVGEEWGGLPLVFYVATYAFMTLGAFAVLTCVADGDALNESYRDFAGLGFKRPFLGLAMSLFMLSLAGFPPLAGFAGKFYIFRGAVLSGHLGLAIIGVLNSLLSVIYYLRVIVAMYMEEGGAAGKSFAQAPYVYIAIALAVIGTIYLGVLPATALDWSRVAFSSLE